MNADGIESLGAGLYGAKLQIRVGQRPFLVTNSHRGPLVDLPDLSRRLESDFFIRQSFIRFLVPPEAALETRLGVKPRYYFGLSILSPTTQGCWGIGFKSFMLIFAN